MCVIFVNFTSGRFWFQAFHAVWNDHSTRALCSSLFFSKLQKNMIFKNTVFYMFFAPAELMPFFFWLKNPYQTMLISILCFCFFWSGPCKAATVKWHIFEYIFQLFSCYVASYHGDYVITCYCLFSRFLISWKKTRRILIQISILLWFLHNWQLKML